MKIPATLSLVFVYVLLHLVESKIVYLNGTEVLNARYKIVNVTTAPQRWISVFNPKNISNHSGLDSKPIVLNVDRKNDDEEKVDEIKKDEKNEPHSNGSLTTRDTTVLSSIRGIWSDLSPMLTVLSTILGLFFMFILMESPLSPLPVPPLPHSPVGPFPPTNMYPYGIPPPRNHYTMGYVGPPSHASYRIPRQMRSFVNETDKEANQQGKLQKSQKQQTNMWSSLLKDTLLDEFGQFTSGGNFMRKLLQLTDSSQFSKLMREADTLKED